MHDAWQKFARGFVSLCLHESPPTAGQMTQAWKGGVATPAFELWKQRPDAAVTPGTVPAAAAAGPAEARWKKPPAAHKDSVASAQQLLVTTESGYALRDLACRLVHDSLAHSCV